MAAVGQRVGGPPVPARGVVLAHAVAAAPQPAQNDATHRLNHKKLHITQAALGIDEITNEQVLAMARSKGELIEFSIGDEVHPTPADPNRPRHKHYYLHYAQPINHRDARYCTIFDMAGRNGRVLHPHIQGVGPKKLDRANVIYYSQKDKLYIASPHLQNYNQEARSEGWAIELNNAESVHAGMNMLMQRHPQVYYMHGTRIKRALAERIGSSEPSPYALSDFTHPRLDLRKAVVLQGASHIGKTQFALAHFAHPLLVSELDDLAEINMRTDGIVFDQMSFTLNEDARDNMDADQIIRLLDMEVARSIRKRYQNAKIPKMMPRIFTTNRRVDRGEPIFPRGRNAEEQEGIDSRLCVMPWMDRDLRRNAPPNARGANANRVGLAVRAAP